MKFIPALIIFVFTIFALTNSETTYSGFKITSADPKNPCSISVPQTDVGTKCIDVCGQGNINIAAVSGETNKYDINGYQATDQCKNSAGQQTLTCGTPVTVGVFSIDCAPDAGATTAAVTTAATTAAVTTAATTAAVTTASTTAAFTTTGTSSTIVIPFALILSLLLSVITL
ncbi:ponticulin-related protein [Dictyostelium discoideum AX4]|uniref:Ponticulin-like protein F n=1 Tax=Dictyostelium discoideum TaxID=44689 RepID=PONF_DICDI|nr:ponticulin-related protein [Dictyostelium discoideum AX4]Q54LH6.1 RecName: Full=Ponticulin-like protein F; Flags: Precursor [Dictyostelium discoideum]EAL64071.1 ponticulin-related protein [Dictyostelium discoideum AX4]|eukprot:XP_637585.1 ponticulin-related protein [Dictyostelium discoideum AX4]